MDSSIIGRRIKFFRQRAKLSQMELELKMDAAFGTISRIESGRVNPTKETILTILNILKLNSKELDYIIGSSSQESSEKEIQEAIKEVEPYFKQKVLAYLIDDRSRICHVSNQLIRLMNINSSQVSNYIGKTTIQLLTNQSLGIINHLDDKHLDYMLEHSLSYYHKENGFMFDDKYYQGTINDIEGNYLAKNIWDKVKNSNTYDFKTGRKIYFKLFQNISVTCKYEYESLLNNSRFRVAEFIPEHRFIRFLNKNL